MIKSITKYELLKTDLKKKILDGTYLPGDLFPSQNQLMQQKKVSYSTVSRVLKELQNEGFIKRKRGCGSFVSEGVSAQRKISEFTIKVVVFPWFKAQTQDVSENDINIFDIYKGLLERSAELKIPVENVHFSDETEIEETFFGENDFFFLTSYDGFNRKMASELKKRKIPFLCHSPLGNIQYNINSISVNVREMSYRMTQKLIEAGHRTIAFCYAYEQDNWVVPKIAGYKQAMAEANLPVENLQFISGLSMNEISRDLDRFLKQTMPTAIMAHNDSNALLIIKRLTSKGIHVPEDIAVVGFDNIPSAAKGSIKLSTCEYPRQNIGRHAVDLMLHLSKYPNLAPIEKTLTGKLIFRDSFKVETKTETT
jgi:DNA-binding LacI/PurR family transcriptional regulator